MSRPRARRLRRRRRSTRGRGPPRRPRPRPPPASSWAGCRPTADPSHGARLRERSALKATQWVAFDTLQRMYVRWQTYRSQALNPWQRECNDRRAPQGGSGRERPRPRQATAEARCVSRQHDFRADRLRQLQKPLVAQCDDATRTLGQSHQSRGRDRILASIAERVGGGPPTAAALEQFEREL
jgi:hypothetical protein